MLDDSIEVFQPAAPSADATSPDDVIDPAMSEVEGGEFADASGSPGSPALPALSAAERSAVEGTPDPCVPTPVFSPAQDRDHESLVDAVGCDVRRRILTVLAAAACRVNVTELARRVGVPQDRVSHHLGILRDKGLLHDHRAGRFTEYECAPGLVRLERLPDGRLCLTLARGNGVEVTLTAPAHFPPPPPPAAPPVTPSPE